MRGGESRWMEDIRMGEWGGDRNVERVAMVAVIGLKWVIKTRLSRRRWI
jgi:hypothetical protein